MANYNCTQLGCIQDSLGTFTSLAACQTSCVGWGCPPQLNSNTDIVFVYDNSGSYAPGQAMENLFKAATAWTETLAQGGWTGTQRHSLAKNDQSYPDTGGAWTGLQTIGGTYINGTDTSSTQQITFSSNQAESWLGWGVAPYYLDSRFKSPTAGQFPMMTNWSMPVSELALYWVDWRSKPTVKSLPSNGNNTGATIPTNDVLVVSFCHETSDYDTSGSVKPGTTFKNHYQAWDFIYSQKNSSFTPKGFLASLFTSHSGGAWNQNIRQSAVMYTAVMGVQSILNGNQNDVANGGTGTQDGTWITIPPGGSVPNMYGVCSNTMPQNTFLGTSQGPNTNFGSPWMNYAVNGCSTVPGGMGTTNPCIVSETIPIIGCPSSGYYEVWVSPAGWSPGPIVDWEVNNFWIAGQPTWGGLEDKGWGTLSNEVPNITASDLATYLNDFVGIVSTPATVCISAETLWNGSTQVDYPYQTIQICNDVCFPYLDPWRCENNGTPCYQSPLGTFTFGSGGIYTTSQNAYDACSAQCNTISAYTCNQYGCVPDASGIFGSLSACTAECESYSCTTNGCYGPFPGTGNTGTYLEMSSCTATCYHYECVTDSYAASVLPNIYETGNTSINGCVQLSGSVGTSPNMLGFNEYTTLGDCTGSCISWGCCEPLGITDNSVMYVYYDITSMNPAQVENAIKGIIDWTETHTEFTGDVNHILIWSERWLTYPTVAYTGSITRFTDSAGPSSSLLSSGGGGTVMEYSPAANFGTTSYAHSSGYWTGTNSPANVLSSVYNSSNGFSNWKSPAQYTGVATHTIYDSFTPGTNLGTYRAQAAGYYTQGYDGLPISLPTDDVINIIFQDESFSMYHPSVATWGGNNYPSSYFKNDHALYFTSQNSVTATTLNNSNGGTVRSFLYPTAGANTSQSSGFALHSVGAISSGDLTPSNGLWSATTYPLNNTNNGFGNNPVNWVHAECEFDLPLLAASNPYWTGNAPTWGGLDQFGWFINFRFDTYSQSVFENDLTAFLVATTLSCDTICSSASTAPTPSFPYTSETLCVPQCVEYNCGDMGCYSAITGEYSSLSACTAQCESFSCGTSGCEVYNQPTGTTFPITQTDGVSYYSYYGSGGTFSSNTDCELVCDSWDCGPTGCYSVNGNGGIYSSQTQCQESPCSGYTCVEQVGCITYNGDGSNLATALFPTEYDCLTGCTFWECTVNLGCVEQTGATTGSIYEFSSLQICQVYCASFNCGDNGCTQLNNLLGSYQDITQVPSVSSAACETSCISYNCTSTGCTDQIGTGGTYDTNAICEQSCMSYTCTTYGCDVYNSPNYGTGGTFTSSVLCGNNCSHWKCVPTGCQSFPGTGVTNSYSSLTQCLDVGFNPVSGVCTTYDCTDTGCIALTGTGGQFSSMNECTGVCKSYICVAGNIAGRSEDGINNYTGGGCVQYNTPTGGTGGTFQQLSQCNKDCRSWDCTFSGCNEMSYIGAGSGATYLTSQLCNTACTSYNCTDTGCLSQIGSGGTWFGATDPNRGLSACTGTCLSYNCLDNGCLPAQTGSGGTYFSLSRAAALTACTTACTSYECYTGGCATFNSPFSTPPGIGYGTGGTYSAMSSCTGSCIHWGCLNNPISTDTNIYAYYDTTSMSITDVQQGISGLESWVSTMQNFTGSIYHTLVNDERWVSWASSVYVGAFTAGTSTMFQNPIAMLVHQWASIQGVSNLYDNMVAGQTNFLFPGAITKGPAPVASVNSNVLVVTFIDESGPDNGLNTNNVYTSDSTLNSNIPNFTAPTSNPLDQPTPTWVDDYSGYSGTYATVLAGTGSLNCFIYPTKSSSPQSPDNQLFALHVVAAVDSGNKTAGPQGENWLTGTAPRKSLSSTTPLNGIAGGTPGLCSIADLIALEISNPYLVHPTGNVGQLDTKGWGYNISFDPFTTNSFTYDLDNYLSTTTSNLSLCVSAQTSPTTSYPHPTLADCTGSCYSWECTNTGCVKFNGTGGTPTYYSLESDCISACTSVNCTSTGCTDQLGTGGTFTDITNCLTACTSFNCEDITTYTVSSAWPTAPGCIEQPGSGGTFYTMAAGSSGSSIMGYTSCTELCTSWNCDVDCVLGTTGCTQWPNTASTYSSESACTGSCVINWYCTEEYLNGTCNNKIVIGQPGGVINNGPSIDSPATNSSGYGALGWFADNSQNATWANYSFSMGAPINPTNGCPGPWIAQNLSSTNLPGYLNVLHSVTFNPVGAFSPNVTWPRTYTDWTSLISDFAGLGVNVNLSMNAQQAFGEITGPNKGAGWNSLKYTTQISACVCYTVPCDVFCDDGLITIPATALGPYATSGAAETNCCTQASWSCVTETIIDSCSGKTTLPGQYASNTNAWDWLTVNLPNTNLNTLIYESTTPAINISGACEGPNGGALYDIEPVAYSLLSTSTSYNVWNLFINQLQANGTSGVLSGMSYSNVNQYLYAQSGQTIKICEEICHCSTTPCKCIEVYDGSGQYLTQDDCMSGTTLLPACCPNTGTTGTSWDCTSGITFLPICDTKPYIGMFNDQFIALDNFRVTNPTGIFGQRKYTSTSNINSNGVSVPAVSGIDVFVWSQIAANSNPAYQWQSCYKHLQINATYVLNYYIPYKYIKTISHPAVSGGLGYTSWNSFYTAASIPFPTLTTTQSALQVCQTIDSVYWASNQFGCNIDMAKCCNRQDCYCYETYTTGGTFSTEAPCLTACCPTYTGWTCEMVDPNTNASTYTLPCYFISQNSPIISPLAVFYDTALTTGQFACNNAQICDVPDDFWSCVTTDINTCDPNGDSLGEITGTTSGPAIALNGVQYPFSSSTDQLFPLLPTGLGYLGAYGQVETILTDSTYYSPFLPLSSTTFQLGSLDSTGQNVVNPNNAGVINPLPYTLPTETCMGTNATGGTGMPLFHINSVSHNYINANTPYYTWNDFIVAAVGSGYAALTSSMSVADVGMVYPLLFSCSETMLNGLQPPSSYPTSSFSGCNWHFEMLPCLCDTTCCCETGFTQGFNTEQECLDPVNGCCPELSSYTCTINGCIDPGNGSGEYTGITAEQDCISECKEWKCEKSETIYDSCVSKTVIPPTGVLPNITEFAPGFSGPYTRGPWDALAYFANIVNGIQGQTFDNYKWECGSGCAWSLTDCDGPNGTWKHLVSVNIRKQNPATGVISTNLLGSPYTDWVSLINGLNTNLGNYFNLSMSYNDVAQMVYNGVPGTPIGSGYEIVPSNGSCYCNPGPCDCVLTGGTGHTGTYHLNDQLQCEYNCCSGITIPECSILITGKEEGVLYYDYDTNTTTKLFDEPGFETLDIAARQDKLWLYKSIGGADIIREYDVVWSPFQKVFNRDITVPLGLGRGLTATQNPNKLISATNSVYELDITTTTAVATPLFGLPSGLTCTGDIIYDTTNGGMVITYGTGTSQYVGRFDGINATPLEESHINLTTLGIGMNESIDSLFNYGTWTPVVGGLSYFNAPYNGPIYGITTNRRVIELLSNPLQFAPVETQTLTLVNQITNKVNGATNIINIINGQIHDCVVVDVENLDKWWCDELLGCLSYPGNITPPNSFGPHLTLVDCQHHCNFVCGDCVGSCECTLVTTTLGTGCNIEPTMADCIALNLSNTNTLQSGDGCCDCFGCESVTYYGFQYSPPPGVWVQNTVISNVSWGNFATVWSPAGTYTSGDVVRYMGVDGEWCCYTYVNPLMPNSNQSPLWEWEYYLDNYTNNMGQATEKIYWIPCDEDCPTTITWDCNSGTTSPSQSTCDGAVDTGLQGLSFTPQIEYIANSGYVLWNTQFEDLKWDMGGVLGTLPTNPCVAPMAYWAKIVGCRVTHVANSTPTPAQGAIQTTWADFIDHVNSSLIISGVYNFPYTDRWQDLQAVIGNHIGIECIWEFCECSTITGPPACNICDCNVMIYPGTGVMVPMVDIGGGLALGNGTLPYNFNDESQARDMVTDISNGLFNTDFRELKWEKMPWTGCGGAPADPTIPGCTQGILNNNGWSDCDALEPCLGDCNGNNYKWYNGWSVGGSNFPPTAWNNWADLLSDVGSVINAVPGIPIGMVVNSTDNYQSLKLSVGWYYVNVLGQTTANANISWNTPKRGLCGCSGSTNPPSYDPCDCVPVYGPGGQFATSAMCEEVCCSAETSWSCITGTITAVTESVDCGNRPVLIPIPMTSSNIFLNTNPIGYVANPVNGLQTTPFSDLKFVSDATMGGLSSPATEPCYDVDAIMTPNGINFWMFIKEMNAFTGAGGPPPLVSTISWADFIMQLQLPPYNLLVDLTMTAAQVFGNTGGLGHALLACTCPGDPCECIEVPGTLGYPTQASCDVVCCPVVNDRLFECTLNGCLQTSNGTYTTLGSCETDCKEWECTNGLCVGSCDVGGINTPRTEFASSLFGVPDDIIGYIANVGTAPVQSPLLPPITNNMQQADITYYKFDCSNGCGSSSSICPSPHGKWWAPNSMYIESTTFATVYSGPHYTWLEVIAAAQLQGFSVNINSTYNDVKSALASDLREVIIKGLPCYGQTSKCDCILIDGTGHTGTWGLNDYNSCYTSCCQTVDTYDCRPSGCIFSNNGTGAYSSLTDCEVVCVEFNCVEGTITQNTCSGDTFLNVDWLNTTYSVNLTGVGNQTNRVLDYMSNPLYGLQYQAVNEYSYINEQGSVASSPNVCKQAGTFTTSALTNQYPLYTPRFIFTSNSSWWGNDPSFPNATNYNNSTSSCPNPGCTFDTWADVITGCNLVGVTNNGVPMTMVSSYVEVRDAIGNHFNLIQKRILGIKSSTCYCSGSPCSCIDIPGTGHTGNYYTLESDCLIAANSNPCCTPPDDYWYCQPGHSHAGGIQANCVCVQVPGGAPGGYPTLLDCKTDTTNCCDNNYFDCINPGTPQAGCVGLVNNVVGPYTTAQDCYDDCEQNGWDCGIVDDGPGSSGPGGSGYLGCIPCVGTFCQYTSLTAAAAPYFGDAQAQCQDSCPDDRCWKCCMDKFGWITQLSPSLSPSQCKCPNGSVEVHCTGTGPCPNPVSCAPGFVYDWSQCKCVCEPNQSCAFGFHWSYVECKCVPNVVGPHLIVGTQGVVLQSISEFLYQPIKAIINKFVEGVELLSYYEKTNISGNDCNHCTDGTKGICVLDGCLYLINYKKYGNSQIGWKTLLLGSETLAVETPKPPTLPLGPVTTQEGYSCRVDQNNAPTYTSCVHTGSPNYVSYFGNTPPQYATLQDCYNGGCDTPTNTPDIPTDNSPFNIVPVSVPPNTPMPSNNWGQGKQFADGYVCAYAPHPVGTGVGCYLSIGGVYTNDIPSSPNYGMQYGLPCSPWYTGGPCFEYEYTTIGSPACMSYCLQS